MLGYMAASVVILVSETHPESVVKAKTDSL
jgi:hypothetical protein